MVRSLRVSPSLPLFSISLLSHLVHHLAKSLYSPTPVTRPLRHTPLLLEDSTSTPASASSTSPPPSSAPLQPSPSRSPRRFPPRPEQEPRATSGARTRESFLLANVSPEAQLSLLVRDRPSRQRSPSSLLQLPSSLRFGSLRTLLSLSPDSPSAIVSGPLALSPSLRTFLALARLRTPSSLVSGPPQA